MTIRASNNGKWRTEEGYTQLKVKAAFFYAENKMVASTNTGWIQTAFDMIMGLFDWMILQKNDTKILGVVCHPGQAARVWADKAYTWRMPWYRRSYKERHQERVH